MPGVALPGLALHKRVHATRWSITRQDLDHFERHVREWHRAGRIPDSSEYPNKYHNDRRIGPSMYQVNEHFIKPITLEAGGMSYALMLHKDGLEADLFVTHAWAEGVYEFCDKVRRAWPRGKKHLWCCFLANPQNADIGALIGGDVLDSPFALALETATHVIAVPNSFVSIYTRLWCVLEAKLAIDRKKDITIPSAPGFWRKIAKILILQFLFLLLAISMSSSTVFSLIVTLVSLAVRCSSSSPIDKLVSETTLAGISLGLMFVASGRNALPNPLHYSFGGVDGFSLWETWKHAKNITYGVYVSARVATNSLIVHEFLDCSLPSSKLDTQERKEMVDRMASLLLSGFLVTTTCILLEWTVKAARKTVLRQESHLLSFESVRDAHCFSPVDAAKLWDVMRGREDEIDNVIKLLQKVGVYDESVRADLRMGMDPKSGRQVNVLRLIIVCIAWALLFRTNPGSRKPATPFGYWTYKYPISFFITCSLLPLVPMVFLERDGMAQRRIEYASNLMWQGIFCVTAFYGVCVGCPYFNDRIGSPYFNFDPIYFDMDWGAYWMAWFCIVIYGLCAILGILGPDIRSRWIGLTQSRSWLKYVFPLVLLLPIAWAGFISITMQRFGKCVAESPLTVQLVHEKRGCAVNLTVCICAATASLFLSVAFILRYVKRFGSKEPQNLLVQGDNEVEISTMISSAHARVTEKILSIETSWAMSNALTGSHISFQSDSFQNAVSFQNAGRCHVFLLIFGFAVAVILSIIYPDVAIFHFPNVLPLQDCARAVAFSDNGILALTVSGPAFEDNGASRVEYYPGSVDLWRVSTGRNLGFRHAHADKISAAAFSPDGRLLLTGSFDKTARVWKISTGQEMQKLKGHARVVYSVAFSRDGKLALTGSADATARIWEVKTGKELQKFDGLVTNRKIGQYDVSSVAFSLDGKLALQGNNVGVGVARILDVATGKQLQTLRIPQQDNLTSLAFSPDAKLVLAGAKSNTAWIWKVDTGERLQKLHHTDRVNDVAFSPDGKLALTVTSDSLVMIWEVATGKRLQEITGHKDLITSLVVSPDGKLALTGGSWDETARIWDVATGKELQRLEGHGSHVDSVTFSPDGKLALTGSLDYTARMWKVGFDKGPQMLEGRGPDEFMVAFSLDGKLALTASRDMARILEVGTGKQIHKLEGHKALTSVAFSSNSKFALTACHRGEVKIWEVGTGKELQTIRSGGDIRYGAVAFSPNSKLVLTGSLWDVGTGKQLHILGGQREVNSVAFSIDGKLALIGYEWSGGLIFNVSTGTRLQMLRHWKLASVALSHDGKLALTGSRDPSIARIWDVSTGRQLQELKGHNPSFKLISLAFSPDGKLALTGSSDRTARMWNVSTGKELHTFKTRFEKFSVGFSADGKIAQTANSAMDILSWDVERGALLRENGLLCRHWLD